jgi:hypothetical protein
MRSKFLLVLLCLATSAVALRSGLRGIDFGTHWDEGLHLSAVQHSAATGNLLPERYLYPSFTHAVMLAVAADRFSLEQTRTPPFKLRARTVLLLLSFTTLLAVWGLATTLGWGAPTAALSVCLLASSWEFVYHSRWIAPDMLLAPFALLSLIAALRGWWTVSAVAAGLCCGVKYPGGLALFTGWLALLLYHWQRPVAWVKSAAVYTAFFALAYFATTPGTLLEPAAFVKDLQVQVGVYSSGHFGYSVPVGPVHLGRMLNYLAQVALSPYRLVALSLGCLALFGLVEQWRRDRRQTLLLIALPIGWLLFFSLLKVMIVRNIQVVVPYLAVFAARGAWLLGQRLGPKWGPRFVGGLCTLAVAINLAWLWPAPLSPVGLGSQVGELIQARREQKVWISPASRRALLAEGKTPPPSVERAKAERLVFILPSEPGAELHRLRANKPGRYATARAGSREANLDYYPTWTGDDRPVSMTAEQARIDGVLDVLSAAQ